MHRRICFRQSLREAPLNALARSSKDFIGRCTRPMAPRRRGRLLCRLPINLADRRHRTHLGLEVRRLTERCGSCFRVCLDGLRVRDIGSGFGFGCLCGLLERLDRLFEGEAMRAQQVSSRRAPVANNGGQHDGAVDSTAPSTRGGGGGLQDLTEIGGNSHHPGLRAAILQPSKVGGHIAHQLRDLDLTQGQDRNGIRILRQRQKEVLKGDFRVRLLSCIISRPRQGIGKIARWRQNLSDLLDDRLRHRCAPSAFATMRTRRATLARLPPMRNTPRISTRAPQVSP